MTTVGEMKAALAKVLPTLPHQMGVLAVAFSMERFRQQNWLDKAPEPWKKRKKETAKNKGKSILMQSGTLRNSIRVTNESAMSVTIGSNIIYAKIHNEGSQETVQVRAHERAIGSIDITELNKKGKQKKQAIKTPVKAHSRKMNMPKRQYMGKSESLINRQTDLIAAAIIKALKQ
jgi:phage gpG-like protein